MVSTARRRWRCNPARYLFVSTLRPKVLWRRLLGYGPTSRPRSRCPLQPTSRDDARRIRAGQTGCNPPAYLKIEMFPAPKPSLTRVMPSAPSTTSGDPGIAHLRVVDADSYTDWESVYRDNIDRLYRLMYARVGNRADAEDLTSEVFRTALGPLKMGLSKGEVRSYLLTTAQTVLASHWRRTLGAPVTSIDPDSAMAELVEPSAPEEPSDAPRRAAQVLAALPERYRRILELRFLEACSIKEAAQAMGVSVSNAKVLQHRALRMAAKAGLEVEQ
jgi:RNA polymerase sigma factor (sigma-70 family)